MWKQNDPPSILYLSLTWKQGAHLYFSWLCFALFHFWHLCIFDIGKRSMRPIKATNFIRSSSGLLTFSLLSFGWKIVIMLINFQTLLAGNTISRILTVWSSLCAWWWGRLLGWPCTRRWQWEQTSTKPPSSSVWPAWYTAPLRLQRKDEQKKVLKQSDRRTGCLFPPEENLRNQQRSYLDSQIGSPRRTETGGEPRRKQSSSSPFNQPHVSEAHLWCFCMIRLKSLLMLDVNTSHKAQQAADFESN